MKTNTKNVLMFLTNGLSPDIRVEKEAISLIANGYDVTLICWDRNNNLKKFENYKKIKVYRIRTGKVENGKIISMLKSLPRFYIKAICLAKELNKTKKFSVVHCHDFDTMPIGTIISKKINSPLIYDLHDLYSSNFQNKLLKNIISIFDSFFYKIADKIIIVNDDFRKLINTNPKKFVMIMNVPDSEKFSKVTSKKSGLFYAGNLENTRDMTYVLEKYNSKIPITIAGDGALYNTYNSFQNKSVKLLGRVSHSQVIEHSKNSFAIIALYNPRYPNVKLASPNKLFDAMKFGKPVIVSKGTTMSRIVEKYHCGVSVKYGDFIDFQKALNVLSDTKKYSTFSKNARESFEKYFNWEIMEKRLISMYEEIIK
ncbi:glycosyltransferase family 4 protein [Candidatus Woesearchaeota archaeon]|nr:glycosyltransferase family 4 protein [Candidatus Woesearchaeota archaeon]